MLHSKEQMVEQSKVYFDNNNIDYIFCTSDGNFFYPNMEHAADFHAKSNKLHGIVKYKLTKDEVFPIAPISEDKTILEPDGLVKKIKLMNKQELIDYAKEKEIQITEGSTNKVMKEEILDFIEKQKIK